LFEKGSSKRMASSPGRMSGVDCNSVSGMGDGVRVGGNQTVVLVGVGGTIVIMDGKNSAFSLTGLHATREMKKAMITFADFFIIGTLYNHMGGDP